MIAAGLIERSLLGESRDMCRLEPGKEAAPLPAPTCCVSNMSIGEARCPPQSTKAVAAPLLLMDMIVSLCPALHAPCPATSATALIVTPTPRMGARVGGIGPPGSPARRAVVA